MFSLDVHLFEKVFSVLFWQAGHDLLVADMIIRSRGVQKVVEFGKRKFWTSVIDIDELNNMLAKYNSEGWRAVSLIPNTSVFGGLISYTILLENPDYKSLRHFIPDS